MAPLWKAMLSRSSPLYRDSLFSFSLWERKAQERELLLLKRHCDRERRTLLAQIHKLSKELQQKDKIIESLRTKLNQHHPHHHHSHRSDTPCSSHALSDATDQSDRISYVSDEQGSTNEDLELCSDVDAASELGAEETSSSTRVGTDCPSHMSHHTSGPPSIASSHKTPSCLSCPSMHCPGSPLKPAVMQSQTAPASVFTSAPLYPPPSARTAPSPLHPHPSTPRTRLHGGGGGGVGFTLAEVHQELQMLQRQLDSERFSTPQSKPPGFLFARQQTDPSSFLPLSLHGYQASPYGSGLDAGLAMKAGASLLESSALWDTTYNLGRPARLGADLSSGSSGYQSGTSHAGSDLMKEHLREVRSLRQRLEDSIQTNERLRQQLEDRLTRNNSEKGSPTNIYIQGLDSVGQLSSEIRLLKEENVRLLNQLRQASAEGAKEAELLREAALSDRARLKEAELEVERWAEQSRKSQAEAEAHNGEIAQLKQDRQRSQETINRLQHEVNILQQQLLESRSLVRSLQCELQVCHGGGGATSNTHSGPVGGITFDPRQLHVQLEPQLIGRPRARRLLFNDNARSPPVRDTGLGGVPSSPLRSLHKHETGDVDAASTLQGQVPDGSFASRHGRHAVGHIDDFQALQQQVVEGGTLLCRMEVALRPLLAPPARQEFSPRQDPDAGSARTLLSDAQTLRQILEEADALLGMFWRATLPNPEETKQTDEVVSLRLRLSEQEQALKDVMERVRSCDRTRDNMENFIVSQLSRTRDVLRKAKTNLQENQLRISALRRASSSIPPLPPPPSSSFFSSSSSSSSSSRPWPVKGESAGGFCELAFSPGWSVMMTPHPSSSSSSSSAVRTPAPHQRPLQAAVL